MSGVLFGRFERLNSELRNSFEANENFLTLQTAPYYQHFENIVGFAIMESCYTYCEHYMLYRCLF